VIPWSEECLLEATIYGSTFIPNKAQSASSIFANSTAHWISALLGTSCLDSESAIFDNCLPIYMFSGYGDLQTMTTDKWATSKATQLPTKGWVKLLLLLESALKLNFEAL